MRYNLSELQEIIRNRRSIPPEQFSERKVHSEILEDILESARWAPPHGKTQPWRFKVFVESGLEKLGNFQADLYQKNTPSEKYLASKADKMRARAAKSSAIIAICMERQESEKIPEIEEIEAVACAMQNIHLMCTAYGIAGYWSSGGMTYTDEMRDFLNLGSKDRVLGFFYVGYPSGEWPKGQRRPLEYYTEWISQ